MAIKLRSLAPGLRSLRGRRLLVLLERLRMERPAERGSKSAEAPLLGEDFHVVDMITHDDHIALTLFYSGSEGHARGPRVVTVICDRITGHPADDDKAHTVQQPSEEDVLHFLESFRAGRLSGIPHLMVIEHAHQPTVHPTYGQRAPKVLFMELENPTCQNTCCAFASLEVTGRLRLWIFEAASMKWRPLTSFDLSPEVSHCHENGVPWAVDGLAWCASRQRLYWMESSLRSQGARDSEEATSATDTLSSASVAAADRFGGRGEFSSPRTTPRTVRKQAKTTTDAAFPRPALAAPQARAAHTSGAPSRMDTTGFPESDTRQAAQSDRVHEVFSWLREDTTRPLPTDATFCCREICVALDADGSEQTFDTTQIFLTGSLFLRIGCVMSLYVMPSGGIAKVSTVDAWFLLPRNADTHSKSIAVIDVAHISLCSRRQQSAERLDIDVEPLQVPDVLLSCVQNTAPFVESTLLISLWNSGVVLIGQESSGIAFFISTADCRRIVADLFSRPESYDQFAVVMTSSCEVDVFMLGSASGHLMKISMHMQNGTITVRNFVTHQLIDTSGKFPCFFARTFGHIGVHGGTAATFQMPVIVRDTYILSIGQAEEEGALHGSANAQRTGNNLGRILTPYATSSLADRVEHEKLFFERLQHLERPGRDTDVLQLSAGGNLCFDLACRFLYDQHPARVLQFVIDVVGMATFPLVSEKVHHQEYWVRARGALPPLESIMRSDRDRQLIAAQIFFHCEEFAASGLLLACLNMREDVVCLGNYWINHIRNDGITARRGDHLLLARSEVQREELEYMPRARENETTASHVRRWWMSTERFRALSFERETRYLHAMAATVWGCALGGEHPPGGTVGPSTFKLRAERLPAGEVRMGAELVNRAASHRARAFALLCGVDPDVYERVDLHGEVEGRAMAEQTMAELVQMVDANMYTDGGGQPCAAAEPCEVAGTETATGEEVDTWWSS